MWCIPQVDGKLCRPMEDVLDEGPTQLIGEVREPIPAEPGQIEHAKMGRAYPEPVTLPKPQPKES